jgi:putative two-component system response regulator
MRKPVEKKNPRGTAPDPGAAGAALSVAECHGPRIMIVDDDPQIRGVLVRMLSRFSGSVVQAASAEEALDALREKPPDLVLLDIGLPDRNGHAVLGEIRASADLRLVPVVILSGAGNREDKLRALRAGATEFLAKPFDSEELLARLQSLLQLKSFTDTLEEAEKVIVALARTIDARDPYTAGHSGRVSMYADLLGEHIELPEAELKALHQGTLFHDLGKIAVRDEVLNKAGRLSAEEFEEMKRHPEVGRDLLRHMRTLAASLPVVAHHHEHLDGSGYPDKLSGAQIPRIVRIASIADVYDGMTSARPYREAMPAEEALQELAKEAARGWWDADLVKEFRGALENLRDGRAGLGLARRARRAA